MNEAKELLQIDWKTVLLGIIAIAAFIKVAIDFIHWITKQFGIEFRGDRMKKEQHEMLMKTINRMDNLEKSQKDADNAIKKDIQNLALAISTLSKKVDEMADKSDATERADLKDRIAQRYRRYSEEKKWTKMEKESFLGLIRDYEAHGGENSFVHTICEPASYTWDVVDADEDPE